MRNFKDHFRHRLDVWAGRSAAGRLAWSAWMKSGADAQAGELEQFAAAEGLRLDWRPAGVAILRKEEEVLVRHDAGDVYAGIKFFDIYMRRGSKNGCKADYRPPVRCRSDELGTDLWYSSIPEVLSAFAGYLAKGGPGEGDCVFDFGAYCGETALAFARLVGDRGKVFAFEPDRVNFEILKRNIMEQGATNVIPIQKGVAAITGTLQFRHGGGLSAQISALAWKDTQPVEVVSYGDACALAGCEPDFVKIDVEGAELEIIQSALPMLAGKGPRFAIASYHVVDGRQTSGSLEEMFKSIGYQAETGSPDHPTTWAWR
jgi:FkbM family methyltransferase